ncbi:DUF4229 domain-containing protein [Modestobacter sp. URMC 112]
MADQSAPAAPAAPSLLPALLLYTLGRLVIVAVLYAVLAFAGLPGIPGALFALLLGMPAAYFLLRPVRERLTAAIVARAEAKEALRARLRGSDTDDAAQ